MAIRTIDITNVLTFQRQWRINNDDTKAAFSGSSTTISDGFHLKFCDGINVVIGENGVGKTSLLKMIYAATQWSFRQTDPGKTRKLLSFFSEHLKDSSLLKNYEHKDGYCGYALSDGEHTFEYSLSHNGLLNFENWLGLDISAVFIPTTEMLSHAKGFLALNQKYNLPFDGTQIDIIVNASLPETKEITTTMSRTLEKISKVIEGTVVQSEDIFYVQKKDGRIVDFSLEAEGFRKFGLLWKLIRNGLLEPGSILLWDEPEANLNPELYPVLVETLLELTRNGVQIFLATHSYNFAKYLEIRRDVSAQVLFHNLYWGNSEISKPYIEILPETNTERRVIYGRTSADLEGLPGNHIMAADEKLLDEVYNTGVKG